MSLLRKGILATFGSIIGILFSTITQMILSRKLMPDGMGQYQIFLDFGILATTIFSFGIGQASIYFINRIKSNLDQVIINLMYAWLITSITLSISLLFLVNRFTDYFGQISPLGIFGFVVGTSSILFVNLLRPVLIAQLRMKEAVLASTILPLIYLVLVIPLAISGLLRVDTAINAMSIGHFSSVFVLVWSLRNNIKPLMPLDIDLFKKMFHYGLKLAISNIVLIASASTGLLLLRYLIKDDFSQIGYYGRAIAICSLIRLIPAAITPALYSKWSSTNLQDLAPQVERAMRMQVALGVVMTAALLPFGRLLIGLLYGWAFLPACMPMYILVFGQVFRAMTDIYVNLFAGAGKPMTNVYILGISIPITFVLSVILVPYSGILGAAWAEAISATISLYAAVWVGQKSNSVKFSKSLLLNRTDLQYITNALFKK